MQESEEVLIASISDGSFLSCESEKLKRALSNEGVRLIQHTDSLTNAVGVFLLGGFNDNSLDQLHRFSRNGERRILVIAGAREVVIGTRIWRLLRYGASDVLIFGESPIHQIAAQLRHFTRIERLIASPLVRDNLVGHSPAWLKALREVAEAALTQTNVLIMGETGTGKELVARLIHSLDQRPNKGELVVVDSTTIVPELSGSELFGHVRGAYTSAAQTRAGAISLANSGTLFLDEVGELPMTLQAEFLRVIEDGSYKPVGSDRWEKANFRLVCATNRDLTYEQECGNFRRDLYHRIAGWVCKVPSLNQRREDIMLLTNHFVSKYQETSNRAFQLNVDPLVEEFLMNRNYPGNVRDLRQIITAAIGHHVGDGQITAGDIPLDERERAEAEDDEPWPNAGFRQAIGFALSRGAGLKEIKSTAADLAVEIALKKAEHNVNAAAIVLGISPRALQLRLAANTKESPNTP